MHAIFDECVIYEWVEKRIQLLVPNEFEWNNEICRGKYNTILLSDEFRTFTRGWIIILPLSHNSHCTQKSMPCRKRCILDKENTRIRLTCHPICISYCFDTCMCTLFSINACELPFIQFILINLFIHDTNTIWKYGRPNNNNNNTNDDNKRSVFVARLDACDRNIFHFNLDFLLFLSYRFTLLFLPLITKV